MPSAAGPEQRIYLEGDQRTYDRGAVLREMRDPLLNVSSHPLHPLKLEELEHSCSKLVRDTQSSV